MMRIDCIVIAYALSDDLLNLFKAVDAPNVVWRIFTHSAEPAVLEAVGHIAARAADRCHVYDYRDNRGLARSWNDGIQDAYTSGADVAVLINDDVLPGAGDVEVLAWAAVNMPQAGIVKCMGVDKRSNQCVSMEFGLCVITRNGWETVGAFDEHITPIYWEDIDWERRRVLLTVPELMMLDTHAVHVGSKTAQVQPDGRAIAQQHYDRNERYYRAKWGATHLDGERFSVPFNDARLSLRIDPAARHNPYPEYAGVSP